MTHLAWTWEDYWAWFRQLEHDSAKQMAWAELLGNGWFKNLAPNVQADVMRPAPMEILLIMKHFPDIFKLEMIKILDHELQSKQKPRNRYRRY